MVLQKAEVINWNGSLLQPTSRKCFKSSGWPIGATIDAPIEKEAEEDEDDEEDDAGLSKPVGESSRVMDDWGHMFEYLDAIDAHNRHMGEQFQVFELCL